MLDFQFIRLYNQWFKGFRHENLIKRLVLNKQKIEHRKGSKQPRHKKSRLSQLKIIIGNKEKENTFKFTIINHNLMSSQISQIQLTPEQFHNRFTPVTQFNDPFAREYFITTDQTTGKRTIYKHYLAEMSDQLDAIFDNIENYLKLNEQDDICKIVACTRLEEQQQVLAAFQYDELSLGQYINTVPFQSNKPLFYIQLLSSLTSTIKSMCDIGIDLDQLNYGNILVYRDEKETKMKVFYDEREKTYDKILQGVKTFTSVEKLTALITGNEEYFSQLMEMTDAISPQNIYQLGLLLIDLMYSAETNQVNEGQADDFLVRDRPVSRSSIVNPEKSYYQIQDGSIVTLNEDYLKEKITYLETNCSHIIKELVNIAKYMIAKQQERITIMELLGQVDRMYKIYRDTTSKKIVRSLSDQNKKNNFYTQQSNKQSSSSLGDNKEKSPNLQQQIIPQYLTEDNQMFGNSVQKNTISRQVDNNSNSMSSLKMKKENQSSHHSQSQDNILNALNEGSYKYEFQGSYGSNKKYDTHDIINEGVGEKEDTYQGRSGQKEYEQRKNAQFLQQNLDLKNMVSKTVNVPYSNSHQQLFTSYSSQKNNYTNHFNEKQKLRQAANSNALSTTKETIGSKTNYTPIVNDHFSSQSNNTFYEQQRVKPSSLSQTKINDVSNERPIKMIIPKEHILMSLKAHQSIKASLQTLIRQVQALPELRKKQYYDNSVYYGEISSKSNKRSGLGLYVYPSGDVYFGTWLENQLVNGTYIFKNGESYEGSVKNGKQGWGRYRYSNGNVYEGEWKDDIKEGKGTMWYPNQDKYEGQWLKGKKNGWGKYFYNNGTLYEGNFMNGRKQGFGTITFPNSTKIQANWQQTHVEGQGKVFYPNGDFFHGEYNMSEKHGKGMYIWGSDNTKYEGEFKKDTLQGEAKIYFTPNEYFFGRIRNGKRDGQGTYVYQNGDSFNGEWKNDFKLIGHYKFKNGDQFEGKFKDNQLNFGVLKYVNGETYEGEFRNGYRHGVGSYRDRNGDVVCEGHWENDNFISEGH